MSVIGRLDNQVNDLLIAPLDKDRRRTAARETVKDKQTAALSPATPTSHEHAETEDEDARREELPVWLL